MKEEESVSTKEDLRKQVAASTTQQKHPFWEKKKNQEMEKKVDPGDNDKCCDCWGCGSFPQGGRAIQTLVLALPAFLFMATALGGCNFVRMQEDDDELSSQLGWGLLWREETQSEMDEFPHRRIRCIAFDDEQTEALDGAWKSSMAFALLAIIVTTVTAMTSLSLSCATFSQRYIKLLAVGFWIALVFQGLSYVGLASDMCDSDNDCILSFGSGILIGSLCLTLMAGGSAWLIQPPPSRQKEVTTTKQQQLEPIEELDEELDDAGSSTLAVEEETVNITSEEEEKEEEAASPKEPADEESGVWQEDWEDEDVEAGERFSDISEDEEEEAASTEQNMDTPGYFSSKKEKEDKPTSEVTAGIADDVDEEAASTEQKKDTAGESSSKKEKDGKPTPEVTAGKADVVEETEKKKRNGRAKSNSSGKGGLFYFGV